MQGTLARHDPTVIPILAAYYWMNRVGDHVRTSHHRRIVDGLDGAPVPLLERPFDQVGVPTHQPGKSRLIVESIKCPKKLRALNGQV